MIRVNMIKNFRNAFQKTYFLNGISPLAKLANFSFSTNSERVLELERNTNIDKIMKHKIFVK
jgi:hypothetical protein